MLNLENVTKRFGDRSESGSGEVLAVDNVSLEIKEGEFFTLLGPSGCGKTTTLRMVAGLEDADIGRIMLGERVLFDADRRVNVAPHQRNLGMVFQSYAIWPHMSCAKNVAYPLTSRRARKVKRRSRAEIKTLVHDVLEQVQLGHLADRPATDLSGGQQQRLALARALVDDPPMLLLDEPLSNLDARLREDMRLELKRLQRDLGITALYVTHDQAEALSMSNRIAVMNRGRVEQLGSPHEIYDEPATRFVADFIGNCNFLTATVIEAQSTESYQVRTTAGELSVDSISPLSAGDEVTVSVRPEDIELRPDNDNYALGQNEWRGEVQTRGFLGDSVDHRISVGDIVLRVTTHPSVSLHPGTTVVTALPKQRCKAVRH